MKEPDIIMDLLARLKARGVEIPPDVAWEVERRIRLEYAGDRVWIARQPPDLRERIRRLLGEGESPDAVCQRFGVSRRTLHRSLSEA